MDLSIVLCFSCLCTLSLIDAQIVLCRTMGASFSWFLKVLFCFDMTLVVMKNFIF